MEEAEAVQGAEAAARNKRWSKPTAAPAQAVEAEAARKRRWWSEPTILHSNTSLRRRCKSGSNF